VRTDQYAVPHRRSRALVLAFVLAVGSAAGAAGGDGVGAQESGHQHAVARSDRLFEAGPRPHVDIAEGRAGPCISAHFQPTDGDDREPTVKPCRSVFWSYLAPAGLSAPAIHGSSGPSVATGRLLGLQLTPVSVSAVRSPPEFELSEQNVQLILEVGGPAEQEYLRNRLLKSSDPKALRTIISWYLNREEYDVANYWIRVADAKGLRVEPWQRLVIALQSDDTEAIKKILDESSQDLPAAARVEALERIGRSQEALQLAEEAMAAGPPEPEADRLNALVAALRFSTRPSARIKGIYERFGPLEISTAALSGAVPLKSGKLGAELKINRLSSTDESILRDAEMGDEYDLSLVGSRSVGEGNWALQLGGNFRADNAVAYGLLEYTRRLQLALLKEMTVKLAINNITYETAFLRALGTKSYVGLGVKGSPTRWDFFYVNLEGDRYQTRENSELATGYKIEGAWGRVLLQHLPRWDFSVRGVWEKNYLVDELPAQLSRAAANLTSVGEVIPAEYRFLGVGTTLQQGMSGEDEPARKLQLLFDIYAGWQWPDEQASYGARLVLGTSFSSRDTLSLNLSYASALSGVQDQSYRQVSLSYDYRF
jgi:hypothetical protein